MATNLPITTESKALACLWVSASVGNRYFLYDPVYTIEPVVKPVVQPD